MQSKRYGSDIVYGMYHRIVETASSKPEFYAT